MTMNFSLNHVGIKVIDLDKMSDFYTSFFGFVITDRRDDPNPIQFMTRSADEHHQLLLACGREPEQPSTVAQISFLMVVRGDSVVDAGVPGWRRCMPTGRRRWRGWRR